MSKYRSHTLGSRLHRGQNVKAGGFEEVKLRAETAGVRLWEDPLRLYCSLHVGIPTLILPRDLPLVSCTCAIARKKLLRLG
jgi:hypothetical protein